MSNLWTLRFDTNKSLPLLVRGNANGDFNYNTDGKIYGKLTKGKPQDPINVIQDFPWTKSPKSSRDDVPKAQLIEKRLLTNSTLTNFFYSILAGADVASSVAQRIEDGVPIQIGGSSFNLFQATSGIAGVGTLFTALQNGANGKLDNALQFTKEVAKEVLSVNSFDQSVLEPYEGLYITEDTGFQYILPYFDDKYNDVSVDMGGGSSILNNISNSLGDVVDKFASVAAIDKPGVYIEGSKQFNMKDQGRTINIKFPLLNTGEYSDIARNWQLIYGLIYQNRPGRINRSLIDVPVIYELFIEGLSYMPYAYMSKMSVDFLGSRRRMKIKVPTFTIPESRESSSSIPSKSEVVMTIPDAYMVDIQLTGLNDETRNFLFRSLGNTIINSTETTNEFTLNPNTSITTGEIPITTPNSRSNVTPRSIARI